MVVGKEHRRATLAPLSDVLGYADADGPGEAGHGVNLVRWIEGA
jgi:hypothetical protein